MDKLQIYQEYRFKKGQSEFYIAEGTGIIVETSEGIYQGYFVGVGAFSECFNIDTIDGVVTINCEDVIDIMLA